ncbi:MAG TPA: HepT-like ribonuclease domain-containing protein [Longimicrobium sp.]|nr:HepT-like ribonuclease domain-containing protein [Longimicrobium sp.]
MLPDERDAGRLWSMVKHARYLVRKSATITRDQLLHDEDPQYSVAKALELIGEAARVLSAEFRTAQPKVPWDKMKGMRHLLVHEYGKVDWDVIWETITIHIPAFLAAIEPLVPEVPPSESDENLL